jgi:hypothetical protein
MRVIPVLLAVSLGAFAQDAALATKPAAKSFEVEPGTHIPLSLINSVSTKHAAAGDRVYLETVFPILSGGRIVIPPGSAEWSDAGFPGARVAARRTSERGVGPQRGRDQERRK